MKQETDIITLGGTPESQYGAVNPPVYRASTLVFPSLEDYRAAQRGHYARATYGRYGSPTTQALAEVIGRLEGEDGGTLLLASGVAAVTLALTSTLKAGDHLLMVDSVYGPTRSFCDYELARFGVETTYYDPVIGADIASLMRPETRVVYAESPGSLTFELQDIPAIAEVAHRHGAIVIADQTWGLGMSQPFALGVDISLASLTKYAGGHSDLVMGSVTCRKELFAKVNRCFRHTGACIAGDEAYLALRGVRTLATRLHRHEANGMALARWLETQPEVERILHPAWETCPGHALWKRDFSGANGLFSFTMPNVPEEALAAMMDGMTLFHMGYSWGGYESLLLPIDLSGMRSASTRDYLDPARYQLMRVHAGLEHPDDLIADLAAGFERLRRVTKKG